MKIAQIVDKFLPITESWIYSQIIGLKNYGINSEAFCHKIVNHETYPFSPIYSYKDIPAWKTNYYRTLGKVSNQDGATIYWNKHINKGNFDLVHSHFGWAAQKGIDLAVKNNIPHIVTFYGADVFRDPFDPKKSSYQKKLPLIFEKSKLIICVSNILKKDLIDLGAEESKIKVWRPGIKINIKSEKYKEKKNNKFNIISVGRFIDWKGQEYLIRALPKVISKYPSVEVKFIGAGPTLEKCHNLSRELNIDSKVKFLGKLPDYSDVIKEMEKSDILIHSSFVSTDGTRDSLGMIIPEAGKCGTPAIASKSGGIPEILIDGKTGLLVREKDHCDIAQKIIYCIENRDKIKEFSYNAKNFTNDNFNYTKQINLLRDIIVNIVDKSDKKN